MTNFLSDRADSGLGGAPIVFHPTPNDQTYWLYYRGEPIYSVMAQPNTPDWAIRTQAIMSHDRVPTCRPYTPIEFRSMLFNSEVKLLSQSEGAVTEDQTSSTEEKSIKVKTSTLTGFALEYMAAKACGRNVEKDFHLNGVEMKGWHVSVGRIDPNRWVPLDQVGRTSNRAETSLLAEDETIDVFMEQRDLKIWAAEIHQSPTGYIRQRGNSPMVAVWRVFVASKFGDVVEVPGELVTTEQVVSAEELADEETISTQGQHP